MNDIIPAKKQTSILRNSKKLNIKIYISSK